MPEVHGPGDCEKIGPHKVELAGGMGSRDRKPRDPNGSDIQWWHSAMGHHGNETAIKMIEQGLGKKNGGENTKKMKKRNETGGEE